MRRASFGSRALAALLRPVAFVLAIVAAVMTGNRTGFWLGLLAFFIAMSAGRALRTLVRGRLGPALRRTIWPAAATGYAILFSEVGLPSWATFFVAFIAAGMTRTAFGAALFPMRFRARRVAFEDFGIPSLDDVVPGRSREL
jgi:hypothetical protein